jgi:hypothetical protein
MRFDAFPLPVARVPFLVLLVAGGIVGVGLVAAFYPYPHPIALLSIETAKDFYAPGEPINLTVVLWLGGNAPVTFVGSPCLAFAVDEPDGGRVFYSMRDPLKCPQAIFWITLQPGERLTSQYTWTQVNNSGVPLPANQGYEIVPVLEMTSPIPVQVASKRISLG